MTKNRQQRFVQFCTHFGPIYGNGKRCGAAHQMAPGCFQWKCQKGCFGGKYPTPAFSGVARFPRPWPGFVPEPSGGLHLLTDESCATGKLAFCKHKLTTEQTSTLRQNSPDFFPCVPQFLVVIFVWLLRFLEHQARHQTRQYSCTSERLHRWTIVFPLRAFTQVYVWNWILTLSFSFQGRNRQEGTSPDTCALNRI